MKDLIIDYTKIKGIDLSESRKLCVEMENQFDTGQQAYHLYAYISTLFNNSTILDIGTEWGNSAICLAYNNTNKVISYDINDHGAGRIEKSNIDFHIKNFMEDSIDWDDVSVILIDVDPHDSIQERKMLKFLEKVNWKGLLLLDDIGPMFPYMNIWFHSLQYEKYMLDTEIGHYSGTGLVNFGNLYNITFQNN